MFEKAGLLTAVLRYWKLDWHSFVLCKTRNTRLDGLKGWRPIMVHSFIWTQSCTLEYVQSELPDRVLPQTAHDPISEVLDYSHSFCDRSYYTALAHGIHPVVQSGLKLMTSFLSQSFSDWDDRLLVSILKLITQQLEIVSFSLFSVSLPCFFQMLIREEWGN